MHFENAQTNLGRLFRWGDTRSRMGLLGQGEPQSMDAASLAAFIRQSFYPTVLTSSDVSFVTEQGILPPSGGVSIKEILFRLIDKKGAL